MNFWILQSFFFSKYNSWLLENLVHFTSSFSAANKNELLILFIWIIHVLHEKNFSGFFWISSSTRRELGKNRMEKTKVSWERFFTLFGIEITLKLFRFFKSQGLVTFFRLSVCVLYSIVAVGGRCKTRLNVSLILEVVETSDAVLFQTQIMSSCQIKFQKWEYFNFLFCENFRGFLKVSLREFTAFFHWN